jgi:hypothetical protein
LSAALRVAAQLPHAVVLTVAGAAHAATFDDACAQRALRGFADGLPIAPCGVGRPRTYAPLALPRAGLQRRAARALTLRWARSDARARYDAQRARTTSDRFGGLRGGWIVRRGLDLALHDVVVVPGLSLTARTRIAPD